MNPVIQIIYVMQLTNFNMIDNKIKSAKFKLSEHKVQGEKSSLSVYQVARLMDMINNESVGSEENNSNILYSLN